MDAFEPVQDRDMEEDASIQEEMSIQKKLREELTRVNIYMTE
jgi:hypothetical protein